MGKKMSLFLMVFIFTGCSALGSYVIQKKHPVGYSKLITLQAECQSPDDTFSGCFAAADMLEDSSLEQAIPKFKKHWENVAFGRLYKGAMNERNEIIKIKVGDKVGYANSGLVITTILRKNIIAFNRIALPILKKIYETNNADTNYMLWQVNLIESEAFDNFSANHVQVFKDDETFPQLLSTASEPATATLSKEVAPKVQCPPAGTEVPFAKVITSGFAEDYVGCDVTTVAQFVALGQGPWDLSRVPKKGIMVAFRVLPPGAHEEKNPLAGQIQGNFVLIPKEQAEPVVNVAPGELVKLTGRNDVDGVFYGVFMATTIKRVGK